jgi:putative copper resistance protein D
VINFLRALSSGEKARELAPVIENEPWLVAPDFNYGLSTGEMKTLKDHREARIVLLVLFASSKSHDRLADLANASKRFHRSDVEILLVPHDFDKQTALASLPMPIVTEGGREIVETYKLFARSFADEGSVAGTPHVEFLIDKQGYIRARWLPSQGDAWSNLDRLTSQIELLKKEKPRAPAPDDHVH